MQLKISTSLFSTKIGYTDPQDEQACGMNITLAIVADCDKPERR
jgi:hypothetical protein